MRHLNLFPFQSDGYEALRSAVREGHRAIIFQLPTGGGKTVVAGHMILRALARGKRCLFVAHRLELVEQPYAKLVEAGVNPLDIGVRVGGEKARRRLASPVQIACIDSLKPTDFAGFDLIVVDEAHRACSAGYLRALAHRDPHSVVIGLTATPERLDGRPLAQAGFTKIVVGALPSELIALERIVEPTMWTVPDTLLPDVSDAGIVGGEFDQKAVAKAVDRRELVGSAVEQYALRGNGRRAIAFCASIPHSLAMTEMFNAAGIPARHVDGNSTTTARKAALADLRSGAVRVVTQCNLWIEGLDEPRVRVAILAKPTASLMVYLQSIGRAVRWFEGQESTVLDHAGNALRHGHPSEDRMYSLEGRSKPASAASVMKRCDTCLLLVRRSTTVCSACGTEFPVASTKAPELAYTPQQLRVLDPKGYKRYFFNKLWIEAYEEGNLGGWVHNRYEARFGERPGLWPEPPKPPVDGSPKARKAKRAQLLLIARVQGKSEVWVDAKMARIFDGALT